MVLGVFAFAANVVKAIPYACEITNISGTIQFYMPESASDVSVIFDSGAVTNDLGALSAGSNGFTLGIHTNYSIVVVKNGAGVFNQVSVDATNNSFFGPRGVTVNRNPYDSFFGRIYVCNASGGTGNAPGQVTGRGLYVLNADTSDALGYHSVAQVPSGMTLAGSTTYCPYKPFVGTDDVVYIGNAANDKGLTSLGGGNAVVWACDPNLTSASVVLQTNNAIGVSAGCISTPFVTGSLNAGNLNLYGNFPGYYTNDAGNGNIAEDTYIYDFVVGGTLPSTSPAITNADVGGNVLGGVNGLIGDVYIAPNGDFFASQNRNASTGGAASGAVSIWEFAPDGITYLWDSSSTAPGGVDPFAADGKGSGGVYGIAVSPDDKYLAAVNGATGDVLVCLLTNGVPNIATVVTNVTGLGGTTRAIAFDAADNIYVASGGNDRLRVYSLGVNSTATTYNDASGTNGSFTLVTPPVAFVSVVAITNQASQSGPTSGAFQITRSGGNTNAPLTIRFGLGGTATNLTYTVSPSGIAPAATTNVIVLPANVLSTNIYVTPVNDGLSRPTTTIVLALNSSVNYVGAPASDTVYVQNTGPQVVFVSGVAVPSVYNVFSNDYAAFTVTRWGNTNAASYPVSFTFTGTAVEGTDYASSTNLTTPSLTINPGDVTDTVYLSPLINGQLPVDTNNLPYVGNKTIIASAVTGGGYTAAAGTATMTILDDAYPPATYLYYDPLTNAMDSNNWVVVSVNDNMLTNAIDEYIDFGYDLYDDPRDPDVIQQFNAVPIPFPPNGATNALRLTVNKSSTQGSGAAAAVNLYLTNAVFSGNYAIRFSMNLVEGANPLYTSEGALFGMNHGMQFTNGSVVGGGTYFATNWFAGSPIESYAPPATVAGGWESDGIWNWVSVDNGFAFLSGAAAYMTFTGATNINNVNVHSLPNTGWGVPLINQGAKTTFANNFKTNVFTTPNGPGLAANASPDLNYSLPGGAISSWSDVELKQMNNVFSEYIDKVKICSYTNTTTFTNGYLMLGYEDPYDSVGNADAAVYYSNLRVVRLSPPLISQTVYNNPVGKYVFNFTSTDGDATPASFVVFGATALKGPYTAVAGATIAQMGNGAFQATVPISGAVHFYEIQQSQ
jgi:hypothetical protein